jgi:hypothetical protein
MPIPDAVFTLANAKAHLRITWADEDADILAKLDSAVQRCEQFCNYAFCKREYHLRFYAPTLVWPLPMAGFDTVVSFKYRKTGDPGITTDVPLGTYKIITNYHGAQVIAMDSWPADANFGGVFAELIYDTVEGAVPPNVKAAAHLYLGDLFENRESQIVGTITVKNATAEALLVPHRVGWGV